MDLIEEARLEGIAAWKIGRSFGWTTVDRDEATAIAIAALFEAQDARPTAPSDVLLSMVRTTVLNAVRDEGRFQARQSACADALVVQDVTSPESRMDREILGTWVGDALGSLSWADHKLLDAWLSADSEGALPRRPGSGRSRWSVRRALDRVLARLRGHAQDSLDVVELPRPGPVAMS